MVFYILVIAVCNLGIGFSLAVWLARRDGEPALPAGSTIEPEAARAHREPQPSAEIPVGAADQTSEPPQEESPWATENELEGLLGLSTQPADASVDGGDDYADDSQAADEPSSTEPPPAEEAPREVAPEDIQRDEWVDGLLERVREYQGRLDRVDDGLRELLKHPDTQTVGTHFGSLRQAGEDYLGGRHDAEAVLRQIAVRGPEQAEAHEHLLHALEEQADQIRATNEVLEQIESETDLETGCRRALHETTKLGRANDALRDTLTQASAVAARTRSDRESGERATRDDPLTDLPDLIALESTLSKWWHQESDRSPHLSVAMLDIDDLGRLNERQGREVGDRVLRATARLLTTESGNAQATIARFSGQRFALLFRDTDLQAAQDAVERLRQTIAKTRFRHGQEDVRITVSCAVTGSGPGDTYAALYERAESALGDAKRYGRNRTFVHEGKYPSPLLPVSLDIEERVMAI